MRYVKTSKTPREIAAHTIATGFGVGLAPVAPGTFGTLVGIPFFLLCKDLSGFHYIIITCAMFMVGVWASEIRGVALGVHDHGSIVWDEVVGYMVTMSVMQQADWLWIVIGFCYFRLFDIWKPWPINWMDAKIKGGFGTMLDDLLAGIFAAIALLTTYTVVQ